MEGQPELTEEDVSYLVAYQKIKAEDTLGGRYTIRGLMAYCELYQHPRPIFLEKVCSYLRQHESGTSSNSPD